MSDSDLTTRLEDIFGGENVEESFEAFLCRSGRTKLPILSKATELVGTSLTEEDVERDTKAIVVIKAVLKLITHSFHTNSEEVNDLTLIILNGIPNFSTSSLMPVVAHCIEYMRSHEEDDIPLLWVEVFGHIVSTLACRKEVTYDDDLMTGKEFRIAIVNELCRLNWLASNTSCVIAAVREFSDLDTTEVDSVICKTFQTIKTLDPSSVPPVAFQLLLLAADRKPDVLVQNFDEYFQKVGFNDADAFTTASQPVHTSQLKRKALGTVVFHFIQSVRHHTVLIKSIIKRIKHARVEHTLIMTPFMLSISMGLTTIEHYKPQVVDALRRSILNNFTDVRSCHANSWYLDCRDEVSNTFMDCFKSVIDSKSSGLDFMFDGLRDLALILLNAENVQNDGFGSIEKCQTLGSYIIHSLVSKHNDYFTKVVDELLKNKKSIVHINCLATCLRSLIRKIVQKVPERISELINHLPLMTVETATPVVKALLPSFQHSRKLLNELIIVLRKTVYKSPEARKISAQAMLLLLSNSRIVGAIPRSQYSESQPVFSQATQTQVNLLGTPRDNESLCFEVLWILKRFFTQPSEVREQLYLGLHVVSRKNPELIKVICSHLVSQVHGSMNNELSEIRWSAVLKCTDSDEIISMERLGHLIQCVSFVTIRGRRVYRQSSEEQPETLIECENLLDKWIEIFSKLTKEDIEEAAGSLSGPCRGNLRPLEFIHSLRNALILQVLQTLEALIEYETLRFAGRNDKDVEELFRRIKELEPLLRISNPTKDKEKGKSGKKVKGKSKGDACDSQKEKGKMKLKQENLSPCSFVHIINLESILEIFKLQSTKEKLNLGNLQHLFDKYVLDVTKQKIERLKKKENLGERERKPEEVINNVASIAGTLWEISRQSAKDEDMTEIELESTENSEDDIQVVEPQRLSITAYRLEILREIVEFLAGQDTVEFVDVLKLFNCEVYDDKLLGEMFEEFFQLWAELVTHESKRNHGTKNLETLFAILDAFASALHPKNAKCMEKILNWCLNYAETSKQLIPKEDLCGEIIKTVLTIGSKLEGHPEKHFLKLARQAHVCLGDLEEEQNTDAVMSEHWLINKHTAQVVICACGLYVEENLGYVAAVLQRLKVQSHYDDSEKIDVIRDKVSTKLTFLINLTTELIRSCFTAGPCVDVLQRVTDQVFTTTTLLIEHLLDRFTRNKVEATSRKFVDLVRLIGTDFKLRVEALITHMDTIERDEADELLRARKGGKVPAAMRKKFMKEARTIPTLVYDMEKYEQQLYALNQKVKVNLLAGTKLSTARDFRIKDRELKEALDSNDKKKKPKSQPHTTTTQDTTVDVSSNMSSVTQDGLSRMEQDATQSLRTERASLKRKRPK